VLAVGCDRRENWRWLVGRRAGRTAAPAQRGRDPPSHRALNLFGAHFQTARFFRILHRHESSGADGVNLLASRNQWRFPLISLW